MIQVFWWDNFTHIPNFSSYTQHPNDWIIPNISHAKQNDTFSHNNEEISVHIIALRNNIINGGYGLRQISADPSKEKKVLIFHKCHTKYSNSLETIYNFHEILSKLNIFISFLLINTTEIYHSINTIIWILKHFTLYQVQIPY